MSKNPIKGYNKYKLRIIMSKNPIKGYNKEDMNKKYTKKKGFYWQLILFFDN